ncbi:putative reverse transcriptase domain-containing protein [Tanacetum coccineum]
MKLSQLHVPSGIEMSESSGIGNNGGVPDGSSDEGVMVFFSSHLSHGCSSTWGRNVDLRLLDKIEKYIGGLPDMIHGSVKASKPKTMQEAIEFTTELMDEKTHAYAERQAERKRKYDDLSKNNQNQQQQNKRQNTGQAYTAGNSDRKSYARPKPLCSKCNYNHEGPCPPRCNNCKKVGHQAKDCRSRPANANNNNRNNNKNNQKGNGCYECGAQGHFRRNCPKLKKMTVVIKLGMTGLQRRCM